MSEKIRVILADDHVVVLQGLRGPLEQVEDLQVVALVQNGDEFLERLEKSEADVVVLKLEMPHHCLTALELRAEGFTLKTESPVQLIEAIRQVAQGRIIFPAVSQRWFMNQPRQDVQGSFCTRMGSNRVYCKRDDQS